jgi:choline dehydrogenase-like flavoprotein
MTANYDVVIVGAGICGAIVAKELGRKGKRVLVLEAGRATSTTPDGYASYVENYYNALAKVPNSPYPDNRYAPAPTVLTLQPIPPGTPDTGGYLVQQGPLPFGSDYLRAKGGTTLHWLGTCLRMLPSDFRLYSLYGRGVDWPFGYDDLVPYYEKAEREIGVAGDAKDQENHGIKFRPGYDYPMEKVPQSHLDRYIDERVRGLKVPVGGCDYEVSVVSTPQGRNSTPRGRYHPTGAPGDPLTGERCEGNASCVPICPVQAKYNALKTLAQVRRDRVDVVSQAVATKVEWDPQTGRVTGITYKLYEDEASAASEPRTAVAKVYVLAAHAIETARLLLASGVPNSSGQIGRNLMDHPTLLTWGLMPKPVGAFRGPGSTSLIPTFRDGPFRKDHSAFVVPIDNWGWSWAAFSPYTDVTGLVDIEQAFGRDLRRRLRETVPRQFTLQFEFEQLPDPANRLTIDPGQRDALGNCRPVICYDISDYTREAMAVAGDVSDRIFAALGVTPDDDHTRYGPDDPGYLTHEGVGYSFRGAGHLVGTHRMGKSRWSSVVNPRQRTWDHENLYLVGCGNMPTLGTSNPTLTIAALAFMAAENVLKDLQ